VRREKKGLEKGGFTLSAADYAATDCGLQTGESLVGPQTS